MEYKEALQEYVNDINTQPQSSVGKSKRNKTYQNKRYDATNKLMRNINNISKDGNVDNFLIRSIIKESKNIYNNNEDDNDDSAIKSLERIHKYVYLKKPF